MHTVDGDAWVLDGELVAIAASHNTSSGIAQKRFEVLEFSDLTRRPRKCASHGWIGCAMQHMWSG